MKTMDDWNEFMQNWDNLHRNMYIPYIKQTTKEKRKELNILISDMKSSLKWCRLAECKKIYLEILNKLNTK